MKKECLFTPEQKQILIQKQIAFAFGKFFASMGFLTSWAKHHQTEFENRLKNRPIKHKSNQLGILFAYYIATKNFNYFAKNRQFDYDLYFCSVTSKGWSGFAYYIFQSLKMLNSDDEVFVFFEELYNRIFD